MASADCKSCYLGYRQTGHKGKVTEIWRVLSPERFAVIWLARGPVYAPITENWIIVTVIQRAAQLTSPVFILPSLHSSSHLLLIFAFLLLPSFHVFSHLFCCSLSLFLTFERGKRKGWVETVLNDIIAVSECRWVLKKYPKINISLFTYPYAVFFSGT